MRLRRTSRPKDYLSSFMTPTKMSNVAGINSAESQKASDLMMKCHYLDEITGAKGRNL